MIVLERIPPKPHELGPKGGLLEGKNPTWRVECPECGDVYLVTAPKVQVERTARCTDCYKTRRLSGQDIRNRRPPARQPKQRATP